MRWANYLLLSTPLLFTACSQRVYDLGVYRYSELRESSYTPPESDVNSSGVYRVGLNISNKNLTDSVREVLEKLPTAVEVDSDAEYQIRLVANKNIKEYQVGEIQIFNSRLQVIEKRISLFNSGDGYSFESKLKEFFRVKRGYILSKRVGDDNQAIFEISLGRNSGLLKGDRVSIYDIRAGKDFLTGQERKKVVKIASGTISDKIYQNRAWITLQKDSHKSRVGLGNLIIIGYNSFKDYLEDGKSLLENHPELLDNSIF